MAADLRARIAVDGGTSGAQWIGTRLHAVMLAALLGCLAVFALASRLAAEPQVPASWREDARGQVVLAGSTHPSLAPLAGQRLAAAGSAEPLPAVDASWLQRSRRWVVGDAERRHLAQADDAWWQAAAAGRIVLRFADGTSRAVGLQPRGLGGLGPLFWLLAALALALFLSGVVALVARPGARWLPFAVLSGAYGVHLLAIAAESVPGPGALPPLLAGPWRFAPELVACAAVVHTAAWHPSRLPAARWIAAAAWLAALTLLLALVRGAVPAGWWWMQGALMGAGGAATALMGWRQRRRPHPLAPVLRRIGTAAVATLALLTAVIAVAAAHGELPPHLVQVGAVAWAVFVAALLLALPLLARTRPLLREFALVAGVSTLAIALDLLLVAVFALGRAESLLLALAGATVAYALARQWVAHRLLGRRFFDTRRVFDLLYRAARDVEHDPTRADERCRALLRDLFEPAAIGSDAATAASRVAGGGTALVVPLPVGDGALVLRHAQQGLRLFTADDAGLADHAVEQLRRVLAVEGALEQGRREERLRLAQDLHDDIGARLLTLMYRAPNREMEDYLRHTLQDLKTLTRGLVAPSHRLSEAAAEWKCDLGQRLQAAQCALAWSFAADRDPELGVVPWSALTRLLRELVTNVIAHARATRVEVEITHDRGGLRLVVADDGLGREPACWLPGLGLGGIRKRVRQLGGDVQWSERDPCGIRCVVTLPPLDDARHAGGGALRPPPAPGSRG